MLLYCGCNQNYLSLAFVTYDDLNIMSPLFDLAEKELLVKITKGDRRAFELFYNRWYAVVYHNLTIFIKDEEDRLDLLQDIFLTIWQKREKLVEVKDFTAFVYILCRNRVFNFLRNTKKLGNLHEEYTRFKEEGFDPAYEVNIKDIEMILQQQIQKLPPKMRHIFELSRFEELSHQEISEKLSISKLTVKKQVQHALKVIKSGFHIFEIFLFFFLF